MAKIAYLFATQCSTKSSLWFSANFVILNYLKLSADVYRQQILTPVGPHTERNKKIIMVVDPQHRYSNEAERANYDLIISN